MTWLNDWMLILTIFLPVAGAGLICLVPSASAAAIRRLAFMTTLVTLALAIVVLWLFLDSPAAGTGGYALEKDIRWIGGEGPLALLDIRFHVGLDGVSVWLFMLTAMLTPLAVWASLGLIRVTATAETSVLKRWTLPSSTLESITTENTMNPMPPSQQVSDRHMRMLCG